MKLNGHKHSKDDEWVLSTIQFTKNKKKEENG